MFIMFLIGGCVGVILQGLISYYKVNQFERKSRKAKRESRQYLRKLMKIRNTIAEDTKKHEYTIYTVKKISDILDENLKEE